MDLDEVTHESVIESLIFSIDSCIHQNYFSFYYTLTTFNTFTQALRLLPTPQQIINGDPEKHIKTIDTVLEFRRQHKQGFDIPRFLRLRLKRTKHFLTSKSYFLEELEIVRQEYQQELAEDSHVPQPAEPAQIDSSADPVSSFVLPQSSTSPIPLSTPPKSPLLAQSSISSPVPSSVNHNLKASASSSRPESPILSPDLWQSSNFSSEQNLSTQVKISTIHPNISEQLLQQKATLSPKTPSQKSQNTPQSNSKRQSIAGSSIRTENRDLHSTTTTTTNSNTLNDTSDMSTVQPQIKSRPQSVIRSPTYFQPVSVYESIVLEGLMHAIQTAEFPFTDQGEIAEHVWHDAFNTWACIRSITNNEIGDLKTLKDWYRHKLHVFRIIHYGKTVPDWKWVPNEYRISASEEQINKFARKKTYRRQAFQPFPLGPRFEELDALFPSTSKYNPLAYMRGYYKHHPHSNSNLVPSTNNTHKDIPNSAVSLSRQPTDKSIKIKNSLETQVSPLNQPTGTPTATNSTSISKPTKSFNTPNNVKNTAQDTSSDSKPSLSHKIRSLILENDDQDKEADKELFQTVESHTPTTQKTDTSLPVSNSLDQSNSATGKEILDSESNNIDNGNQHMNDPTNDEENDDVSSNNCSLEYYGVELSDDDLDDGIQADNNLDSYEDHTFFRKSSRKKKSQMPFDINFSLQNESASTPVYFHNSQPSVIFEDPNEEYIEPVSNNLVSSSVSAPSQHVSNQSSSPSAHINQVPTSSVAKDESMIIDPTSKNTFISRAFIGAPNTLSGQSSITSPKAAARAITTAAAVANREEEAGAHTGIPVVIANSTTNIPTGSISSLSKNSSRPSGQNLSDRYSVSTSSTSTAPTTRTSTSRVSTTTVATSSISESGLNSKLLLGKHDLTGDHDGALASKSLGSQGINSETNKNLNLTQTSVENKYPYISALTYFDEVVRKHGHASDAEIDAIHRYIVKTPHVMLIIFDSYHDVNALILVAKTILRLEQTSDNKNMLLNDDAYKNHENVGLSIQQDENTVKAESFSNVIESGVDKETRKGLNLHSQETHDGHTSHESNNKLPDNENGGLQELPQEMHNKKLNHGDSDRGLFVPKTRKNNRELEKLCDLGDERFNNESLEYPNGFQQTLSQSHTSLASLNHTPVGSTKSNQQNKQFNTIKLSSLRSSSGTNLNETSKTTQHIDQNGNVLPQPTSHSVTSHDIYEDAKEYTDDDGGHISGYQYSQNNKSRQKFDGQYDDLHSFASSGNNLNIHANNREPSNFVSVNYDRNSLASHDGEVIISDVSDISPDDGSFCYSDCDCGSRCEDSQCSCRNYSLQNFDDISSCGHTVPIRATQSTHSTDNDSVDSVKQKHRYVSADEGIRVEQSEALQNGNRYRFIDPRRYKHLLKSTNSSSQQHLLESQQKLSGNSFDENHDRSQTTRKQYQDGRDEEEEQQFIPPPQNPLRRQHQPQIHQLHSEPSSQSLRQVVHHEQQKHLEHLKQQNSQLQWQYQQPWEYQQNQNQGQSQAPDPLLLHRVNEKDVIYEEEDGETIRKGTDENTNGGVASYETASATSSRLNVADPFYNQPFTLLEKYQGSSDVGFGFGYGVGASGASKIGGTNEAGVNNRSIEPAELIGTPEVGATYSDVESAAESLRNVLTTAPGFGRVPISRNSSTRSNSTGGNGYQTSVHYSGYPTSLPGVANSGMTVGVSRSGSNRSAVSATSGRSYMSGQSARFNTSGTGPNDSIYHQQQHAVTTPTSVYGPSIYYESSSSGSPKSPTHYVQNGNNINNYNSSGAQNRMSILPASVHIFPASQYQQDLILHPQPTAPSTSSSTTGVTNSSAVLTAMTSLNSVSTTPTSATTRSTSGPASFPLLLSPASSSSLSPYAVSNIPASSKQKNPHNRSNPSLSCNHSSSSIVETNETGTGASGNNNGKTANESGISKGSNGPSVPTRARTPVM